MKNPLFYDPDNSIRYDDLLDDDELTLQEIEDREMDAAADYWDNFNTWME